MSVLESFAKGQTITKSASAAGRIALNVERAAGDLEDSVAELRSAVSTLEETVNPLLRAPEPEQPCATARLANPSLLTASCARKTRSITSPTASAH